MEEYLTIRGNRNGYAQHQIASRTCTVRQLINYLQEQDPDLKVVISNDNGYTYGYVDVDEITIEKEAE